MVLAPCIFRASTASLSSWSFRESGTQKISRRFDPRRSQDTEPQPARGSVDRREKALGETGAGLCGGVTPEFESKSVRLVRINVSEPSGEVAGADELRS